MWFYKPVWISLIYLFSLEGIFDWTVDRAHARQALFTELPQCPLSTFYFESSFYYVVQGGLEPTHRVGLCLYQQAQLRIFK